MAEQTDFLQKFIKVHPVSDETYGHFNSIEWTKKFLDDPAYKVIPTYSRVLKPDGEDYFFAQTINTPSTIPHLLTLQLRDIKLPDPTPATVRIQKLSHDEDFPVPDKPDTIHLVQLGPQGLDGHPGLIHGGLSCAILDEMMANCVMVHRKPIPGVREHLFTANLDVNFRRPVPTDGEIYARCWISARQGSRWYTFGQIVGKDGLVLTEAQALWVQKTTRYKI